MDFSGLLDGYLWNLPDCSPSERELLTASLVSCVKFRSSRTGASAQPLSASAWKSLKAACALLKNVSQLTFVQSVQKSKAAIFKLPICPIRVMRSFALVGTRCRRRAGRDIGGCRQRRYSGHFKLGFAQCSRFLF